MKPNLLFSKTSPVKERSWVFGSLSALFFWGFLYFSGTIGGKTKFSILAGEMFGSTNLEKIKGIEPLYTGENQTGWDGQFYYRMSNDLLGNSDASMHIDNPAYRYQRIGLPALAKLISVILNFDYVPVLLFIGTSLFLWFVMLYGLTLLQDSKIITSRLDLFILATWCGIPLTLFTGLTDSAADSLGIIAVGVYFSTSNYLRRYNFRFAVILCVISTLTKESAVVYLLAILIVQSYKVSKTNLKPMITIVSLWVSSLLPILVWQLYIDYKFGKWGFEAGSAISQKVPFGSYFLEVKRSLGLLLNGDFNLASLTQTVGLTVYSALLISASIFLVSLVRSFHSEMKGNPKSAREKLKSPELSEGIEFRLFCFALTFLTLLVQSTMGMGVLFNWTGYLKNSFPLVLIFCLLVGSRNFSEKTINLIMPRDVRILILIASLLCFRWFYVPLPHYTNLGLYSLETIKSYGIASNQPCEKVKGRIDVLSAKEIQRLPRLITGRLRLYELTVDVKNTSSFDWQLSRDPGAYKIGYQWVDANGNVIADGQRAQIQRPLLKNEVLKMSLFVTVPRSSSTITKVNISLIQEGCYWSWREEGDYKVNQQLSASDLNSLARDHSRP